MNPQFFVAPLDNRGSKGAETWHPAPLWMLKGDEDFSFSGIGRSWVWLHRRHLQDLCPKYWVIPPEIVKVPYSEERRETTHTQNWVQVEVSKFFWGLTCSPWSGFTWILHIRNSQWNVRSCFSDIERQIFVYLEEKMAWLILRMEHGKCLIFWMYLCRVLSYFAKEESVAWNKSCYFEHLNYCMHRKASLNIKPSQLNKATLLRIKRGFIEPLNRLCWKGP